jgi:hypothetical protein
MGKLRTSPAPHNGILDGFGEINCSLLHTSEFWLRRQFATLPR